MKTTHQDRLFGWLIVVLAFGLLIWLWAMFIGTNDYRKLFENGRIQKGIIKEMVFGPKIYPKLRKSSAFVNEPIADPNRFTQKVTATMKLLNSRGEILNENWSLVCAKNYKTGDLIDVYVLKTGVRVMMASVCNEGIAWRLEQANAS